MSQGPVTSRARVLGMPVAVATAVILLVGILVWMAAQGVLGRAANTSPTATAETDRTAVAAVTASAAPIGEASPEAYPVVTLGPLNAQSTAMTTATVSAVTATAAVTRTATAATTTSPTRSPTAAPAGGAASDSPQLPATSGSSFQTGVIVAPGEINAYTQPSTNDPTAIVLAAGDAIVLTGFTDTPDGRRWYRVDVPSYQLEGVWLPARYTTLNRQFDTIYLDNNAAPDEDLRLSE